METVCNPDSLQAVQSFGDHPLFYFCCVFATVVGAIAGATASSRVRMDIVGVLVCGTVAALGGGTLRDMVLSGVITQQGTPLTVYWVKGSDTQFLYMALATSLAMFYVTRFWNPPVGTIRIADTFSMAFFSLLGAAKAYYLDCPGIVCICMGVCTGVAGGVLRDVLTGNVPYVFRSKEVYASAAFSGSLLFVVMQHFNCPYQLSFILGTIVAFGVRMTAVYLNWQMPSYRSLLDAAIQEEAHHEHLVDRDTLYREHK